MDASTSGAHAVSHASSPGLGPSSSLRLKKRTKTGCLTCRKRRIKCGEEKPRCTNCLKSKRHCEGYLQSVSIRPRLDPGVSVLQYHSSMLPGTRLDTRPPPHQQLEDFVPSMLPRPLTHFSYTSGGTNQYGSSGMPALVGGPASFARGMESQRPLPSSDQLSASAAYLSPHHSLIHPNLPGHFTDQVHADYVYPQTNSGDQFSQAPFSYDSRIPYTPSLQQQPPTPASQEHTELRSLPEQRAASEDQQLHGYVPSSSVDLPRIESHPQYDARETQLPSVGMLQATVLPRQHDSVSSGQEIYSLTPALPQPHSPGLPLPSQAIDSSDAFVPRHTDHGMFRV